MGVADKNLPDVTRAQILFKDEVMHQCFIHVTQQTTMKNRDQIRVTHSGRKMAVKQ